MHAVVRTYSGGKAKQLFDLLEQRKAEVEGVLKSVPGLVSYTLARTPDGGVTVTVCQDKGTMHPDGRSAPIAPSVSEGAVVIHVK